MTIECKIVQEKLTDYISGTLEGTEGQDISLHIQECEQCRKDALLLKKIAGEVKNAYSKESESALACAEGAPLPMTLSSERLASIQQARDEWAKALGVKESELSDLPTLVTSGIIEPHTPVDQIKVAPPQESDPSAFSNESMGDSPSIEGAHKDRSISENSSGFTGHSKSTIRPALDPDITPVYITRQKVLKQSRTTKKFKLPNLSEPTMAQKIKVAILGKEGKRWYRPLAFSLSCACIAMFAFYVEEFSFVRNQSTMEQQSSHAKAFATPFEPSTLSDTEDEKPSVSSDSVSFRDSNKGVSDKRQFLSKKKEALPLTAPASPGKSSAESTFFRENNIPLSYPDEGNGGSSVPKEDNVHSPSLDHSSAGFSTLDENLVGSSSDEDGISGSSSPLGIVRAQLLTERSISEENVSINAEEILAPSSSNSSIPDSTTTLQVSSPFDDTRSFTVKSDNSVTVKSVQTAVSAPEKDEINQITPYSDVSLEIRKNILTWYAVTLIASDNEITSTGNRATLLTADKGISKSLRRNLAVTDIMEETSRSSHMERKADGFNRITTDPNGITVKEKLAIEALKIMDLIEDANEKKEFAKLISKATAP